MTLHVELSRERRTHCATCTFEYARGRPGSSSTYTGMTGTVVLDGAGWSSHFTAGVLLAGWRWRDVCNQATHRPTLAARFFQGMFIAVTTRPPTTNKAQRTLW